MNPAFGRNIIPRKRLFLLPLTILILLSYLSTTVDFANVAIAQDYNEDNFGQSGVSTAVSTSDSDTDEDSSTNNNRDENTNNQGLSGDSPDSGGNDNVDSSTDAQNVDRSSNENSSKGQKEVGLDGSAMNGKLPPRAEAGSDIVTYEGNTVVLNGEKSSDDDGEIKSYHWSQIEGPEQIALRNVDTFFPTFEAPSVSSETKFRFELTVTDNDGLSDSDSVYVTVRDVDGSTENIQNSELAVNSSTLLKDEENNSLVSRELGQNNAQLREDIESNTNTNNLFDNQLSDGPIVQALLNKSESTEQQSIQTDQVFTSANSNQANSSEVNSDNSTEELNDIIDMAISNTTQTQPINSTELQNMTSPTINGTQTQPINSTELQNMTSPTINGTQTQPINSTELLNSTNPITNLTGAQPINSTDLLNLNNTMFNGTAPNLINNKSSINAESLGASLLDVGSSTAFKLKLLSYSFNNSEFKLDELANDNKITLNNSAKIILIPMNETTELNVIEMMLMRGDGSTLELNAINSKWVLDAPPDNYSILITAKYLPGGGLAHYGANLEVIGKKNLPPIADAGEDRVIKGNLSVTLDGSKSFDPNGSISSYHWTQLSGEPFITLADVDTPMPSFVSPSNILNDSNIVFQLAVTDNEGANSTDNVNITIKNTTLPNIQGTVILETVPRVLSARQNYEFKGMLNLSRIPDGSYIQIRNGKGEQFDELITFAPINNDGKFIAPWIAEPRDKLLNIYAAYVDISGNAIISDFFPLKVIGFKSNPGISSSSQNLTSRESRSSQDPFMEIHYNEWDKDFLNVYIMSNDPASQKFIGKSKQAVNELSQILKDKTDNGNVWNFNTFAFNGFPSPLVTSKHPINILINLRSTDDVPGRCGYSDILQRVYRGYVYNQILTDGCDVYTATMHEFLHSLGLGHTWHEVDDMMCSTEWFLGTGKWTCDNDVDPYNDHTKPTEFNLRALLYMYGNNGFQEPNGNIREDYDPRTDVKYYCNPLPCEPKKTNTPPIADAGTDQSSKVDAKVTLDGSKSSDTDGLIESFSWTQIEGPKVKLFNPQTSKPYFFIPTDLTNPVKLVFELTVTDSDALKAADSVEVNVLTSTESKQEEKGTSNQNSIQPDMVKIIVKLNNIHQELNYENSAVVMKGNLFQKQKLVSQQNNRTTAETIFVFPSDLIKPGETFIVCAEQSFSLEERGISCKIAKNQPSGTTIPIEFNLPQSGNLTESISISEEPRRLLTVKIAEGASNSDNQNFFVPFFLKVSKNDHVLWKNEDTAIHTVTSGTPEGTNSGTIFDSGNIASGKSFEYAFPKSGKYDYYCTLHPFMIGQVNVS